LFLIFSLAEADNVLTLFLNFKQIWASCSYKKECN